MAFDFEIEYKWYEKLFMPFSRLIVAIQDRRDERKYRRDRAKRGYGTKDLSDMRYWFVRTVSAMLRDIEKDLVGYPEEISEEEWRATLLKMAHLLDVFDVWDDTVARKDLGLEENDHTAESEKMLCDYKRRAKDEFFELFNKWFYDLGY